MVVSENGEPWQAVCVGAWLPHTLLPSLVAAPNHAPNHYFDTLQDQRKPPFCYTIVVASVDRSLMITSMTSVRRCVVDAAAAPSNGRLNWIRSSSEPLRTSPRPDAGPNSPWLVLHHTVREFRLRSAVRGQHRRTQQMNVRSLAIDKSVHGVKSRRSRRAGSSQDYRVDQNWHIFYALWIHQMPTNLTNFQTFFTVTIRRKLLTVAYYH